MLTALVKNHGRIKEYTVPWLGDAIGFRLKVIQELARSTPSHIIYKFIDFKLCQETGIPLPPPSFLTPDQPTKIPCIKGTCNVGT